MIARATSAAWLVGGVVVAWICAGCLDLESDGLAKKNPDFRVIGHRGAPNEAAENTIDSMQAAIDLGANALEIDLCVTQDGAIVVWHDRDPDDTVALARQAGLEGLGWIPLPPPSGDPFRRPVDQILLADFLATHGYARSGSSSRDEEAPIATWDDFVDWMSGDPGAAHVYLDVKATVDDAAIIVQAAAAIADETTFLLMSPSRDVVDVMIAEKTRLGAQAETLRIIWDFETDGALAGTEELGLRDISTGLTPLRTETELHDEIDEMIEARSKKRIDSITVWTIDSPMQLGPLLYRGVDGVMTNDPEQLYDLWQLTL